MAYDTRIDDVDIIEANRFSNFVRQKDKAALRDLESWVKHFKEQGVHAVVGFTKHGFAVYRVGLEECPED